MTKSWLWKLLSVLVVLIIGLYFLVPTFFSLEHKDEQFEGIAKYFPEKKIKLGLDLQGGIYLQLGVDVEKAVFSELDRLAISLESFLKEKKIKTRKIIRPEAENYIQIELEKKDDLDKLKKLVRDDYSVLIVDSDLTAKLTTGDGLVLKPEPRWLDHTKDQTVKQAIETIKNRIDQFGVTEPSIQAQGEKRIVIQLPGVKDPTRALEVIRKTALLEFKLVDKSKSRVDLETMIKQAVDAKELKEDYTISDINKILKVKLPENTEVYFQIKRDPTTKEETKIPWLVKSQTLLTGEYIEDVRVRQDSAKFGNPYTVSLKFNKTGADVFAQITGDNVGEMLAIILDNKVNSAPVIREKIAFGNAQIELGAYLDREAQYQEANDLAIVLRAGSLPAPVIVEENRTVGPSLGRDSILQGKNALMIACILVIIFMILYYKFAGVIANIALFINMVLILAILSAFEATLTLPGIAGLILTIGMAVDGNVIVFERIREELRIGKTPRSAIESGFIRAHLTILDANITTLIAAIVLFQYGTGPIKGFAVTLITGIFCSYLTSFWASRFIFDAISSKIRLQKLSI